MAARGSLKNIAAQDGRHEARCDAIDVCVVGIEDRVESGVRIVGHVSCGSANPAVIVVVGLLKEAIERSTVHVIIVRHVFQELGDVSPWDCVLFWMAEGLLRERHDELFVIFGEIGDLSVPVWRFRTIN